MELVAASNSIWKNDRNYTHNSEVVIYSGVCQCIHRAWIRQEILVIRLNDDYLQGAVSAVPFVGLASCLSCIVAYFRNNSR